MKPLKIKKQPKLRRSSSTIKNTPALRKCRSPSVEPTFRQWLPLTKSQEVDLARIFPGLLTKGRTITIIEDHSENAENADEDAEKPGLGWFLAILAGITVMYLLHLLIPGRHEPMEKFIARQPTWGSFFRGWTSFVLPIASLLWIGFHFLSGTILRCIFSCVEDPHGSANLIDYCHDPGCLVWLVKL